MPDLLFEVGVEELPASEAAGALEAFGHLAGERLLQARISFGELRVLGTPRRFALVVRDLAGRQPDAEERLVGPPRAGGEKAASGFARKHGVEVSALVEEGDRLVLHRRTQGAPALEILPGLLRDLLSAVPWKKAMRWAAFRDRFARPVLWLLALLDDQVIPVEFGGQKAGTSTRGHRFLAPDPVVVRSVESYLSALEGAHVILDPKKRRERIEDQLAQVAAAAGLRVRADEGLLAEVTWLVEEPMAIVGEFPDRYLEVPEPVIVSAQRGHQRYFALETPAGRLANRFVAVAGTHVRDPEVVRRGNERVLCARLEDARFFLEEDKKVSLAERTEQLRGVVFQRKVGTVYEKVERVVALSIQLGQRGFCNPDLVKRAARIYKADLVTHVVGEFPDLQGAMGKEYAIREGEEFEVAEAVRESYLPRAARDDLPRTPSGAVLSVSERLDTLVGCFGADLAPTGAADPYALRRAAIGLVRIVLDRGWSISLSELVDLAAARYQGALGAGHVAPAVCEFVMGRFRGVVAAEATGDVVEAVLMAGGDDLCDLRARIRALEQLRCREDFVPLAAAFKRVANILKGQLQEGDPEEGLFREPAERALFGRASQFAQDVHASAADYGPMLGRLAAFKPEVDRFFDDVLVMDEDERVKANRLALLGMVNRLFLRVADFRQIAT